MKNYKTYRDAYIELRRARGSRFLFVSKRLSLVQLAKLVFLEYVRPRASDELLRKLVIEDLQEKGILHKKNCVQYYQYALEHLTFHDVYLRTSDNQIFCRGTSTDLMEAYAKALGEVFERTSIKYPPNREVTTASTTALRKRGMPLVSPLSFAQATQEQKELFPRYAVTEDDVFAWVKGRSTKDGSDVLIPAQTIFFGTHATYKEKSIIQQSTHGAGAAFGKSGAICSGLFEIWHRHFFLQSWYFDDATSVVDLATIPETLPVRSSIRDLEARGFSITVLDYSSTARIPTVICLLKNRGGLWCGGSTATTLEGALQRAVSEAFATYLWVQQETVRGGYRLTKESIDALKPGFTDESATAYNRVFSYSNSYFVSKLSLAVLTNTQPIAYTTRYDMLDTTHDYLADAVTRFGDIVTYEATNDYLEEYDYHVCRVVVPQSYYFALDERYSRPLLQDGRCPQNMHINPFP